MEKSPGFPGRNILHLTHTAGSEGPTHQVRVEVCEESSCIVGSQLSSYTSLQQVIRQLVKTYIKEHAVYGTSVS